VTRGIDCTGSVLLGVEMSQGVEKARHPGVLDRTKGGDDPRQKLNALLLPDEIMGSEKAEVKGSSCHEPAIGLEDDEDVATLEGLPDPKADEVASSEHVRAAAGDGGADESACEASN